jgi:hypothetical protein
MQEAAGAAAQTQIHHCGTGGLLQFFLIRFEQRDAQVRIEERGG